MPMPVHIVLTSTNHYHPPQHQSPETGVALFQQVYSCEIRRTPEATSLPALSPLASIAAPEVKGLRASRAT
jgi:hypothetical protein